VVLAHTLTHTHTRTGALLAFLIFKDIFGPLAYGFLFGLVGGMMVIVALKDLLPTAHRFDKRGNVVTSCFILGMFIMAASLIVFEYGGGHSH
jgi:ZIP family zinc transporter